ncbi:MAG: EAL domain-containing protein [Betaproteobacteria bacterium]
MILTQADLSRYLDSPHACWVQDIERGRVAWANAAALRLLRAGSLEELYARDFSPRSRTSRSRLDIYFQRVFAGQVVTTQWTSLSGTGPITFLAEIHGWVDAQGARQLFFDARDIADSVCAEGLRMLEAARHSIAFFSLYSLDGRLLERNAAFVREFDAVLAGGGDRFLALFADAAEGESIRDAVITVGEHRGRSRIVTPGGIRWHMLLALSILDPVDGERVIHVESFDINDQVEAELRAIESEALLQQIADEYPHPVAYVNTDRTYRFVNRTYCNWIGKPREAIIGRSVLEVVGSDLDRIWDELTPRLLHGERVSYERFAQYPGRGERWIQVDVVPHQGPDRQVNGAFVYGYDVHTLKLAESGRKATERQLELITDNLPVAVSVQDGDYRIRFANLALRNWFNLRHDAIIGRHIAEVFGGDIFDESLPQGERARKGEIVQIRRREEVAGKTRWIDITMAPFDDGESIRDGLIAVYADVTTRVEANEALNRVRNTLTSHLANTPLAVIQLDAAGCVTQWTGHAHEIFGWSEAAAIGHTLDELNLFEEDGRARFAQELHRLDHGLADRFTAAWRNVRKDGVSLHADWFGSVLRDTGKVSSYLMLVQDVSARVSAERHLHYIANHDVLTGLANRTQFQERLKAEIARARRLNQSLAVALLDLDRFKYVNESLGHSTGDMLLQEVALRFSQAIGPNDFIARTGGDEFMLLVNLEGDDTRGDRVAEQLRRLLLRPFRLAEQDMFVTASIGVSLFPHDADNEVELIKNTDWAMYRAKDAGRNSVQFYSAALAHDSPMRLSMESELHRAVEFGQLELHYQPKQNLFTKRITGAEALLRWRHPLRGLVAPDEFIPIAEESGLINELGAWVIAEVCRQIADWRARFDHVPQIAINLSAVQLKRRELAQEILNELARHRLPGSVLMVEVTETAVVSDPLLATVSLDVLRDHGVRAAIDDFGKGYSSLTQLKRLPIDALKIDGSFVRGVVVDRDDAAIVQAIIGLAKNLDLRVIAEGLETPEQMAFLTSHQCEEAQGYLISRPLPAEEFAAQFLAPALQKG